MTDRLDVQTLITFLAETGIDPDAAAEAIAIEQDSLAAARAEKATVPDWRRTRTGQLLHPRPQLRVVADGPE
jgi:hypothetical protein